MRTLKSIFGISAIGLVLMMFLAVGCSKEEITPPVADEPADVILKGAPVMDGVYVLQGSTHFPSYAVKEHRVISPWEMNMLTCTANLVIEDGGFILSTEESMGPTVYRTITFSGEISSGGVMKFSWPDTWWEIDGDKTIEGMADQFLLHTGCIQYGPDQGTLNYKGKFDGNSLYASTHFMAKQVQFGIIPFYSEAMLEGLIEGPIQFEFTIELNVVNP